MEGWLSVCLCVCLSVCLSVCLCSRKSWITFDAMKRAWWNFQDQSNLHTFNFWPGVSHQLDSRVRPWAQNSLFLQNLSPPCVLSYRDVTHLFGNFCVNFTSILWAAFVPKSFCQKITNPNCKHLRALQRTLIWLSISPIFYKQLFHTKVLYTPFMCLQFGFVIFWRKD